MFENFKLYNKLNKPICIQHHNHIHTLLSYFKFTPTHYQSCCKHKGIYFRGVCFTQEKYHRLILCHKIQVLSFHLILCLAHLEFVTERSKFSQLFFGYICYNLHAIQEVFFFRKRNMQKKLLNIARYHLHQLTYTKEKLSGSSGNSNHDPTNTLALRIFFF